MQRKVCCLALTIKLLSVPLLGRHHEHPVCCALNRKRWRRGSINFVRPIRAAQKTRACRQMASIRPEADIVFIKSAEVLSVRERMHSPKRFVYEVQVEWSNSSLTTCYRGYTDFFDLQCDLLTTFPYEGGSVKGVERTIPFLPGRKIFQRRSAALAEKRLPQINDYVKKLIVMPEHVSRSNQVLKFFRSNWQEDRLRGGSLTQARHSSSSSNAGLLFHQEGGVEYSVRRLVESEDVFTESYSNSPPLDQNSRYVH